MQKPRLRFSWWVVRRFFHSTLSQRMTEQNRKTKKRQRTPVGICLKQSVERAFFKCTFSELFLMSVSHVPTPKTTCESCCKKLLAHLHTSQIQKKFKKYVTVNNITFTITTIINIHQLSQSRWSKLQTTFRRCFLLNFPATLGSNVSTSRCRSSWPGATGVKH